MTSGLTTRWCPAAVVAAAVVAVAVLVAAGCSGDDGEPTAGTGPTTAVSPGPIVDDGVLNETVWPMHTIDARYKGANALSAADVNGDGFDDYATNYEFDQRYVIALHPGADGDPAAPWPTVTVFEPAVLAEGYGVNAESAALGDVDGDGDVDLIGAQGYSEFAAWEGSEPGIRVIFGPGPDAAADADAWVDAGRVPGTIDVGHLHWVQIADLNGDGVDDVLGGGRVHEGNGSKGGVFWIEAPTDPSARRDLSQWQVHHIDPEQWSGHGSVAADVDGDGDLDVVLANHDFDTPAGERTVVWYENPGHGDPAQRQPWTVHELYRGDEFHTKPQVAVDDLDGDGDADIVTMTPDAVYWFRQTAADPVAFERIVIEKDPRTRWLARPIRIVDLDGDGRKDLVGMLVHERADLPGDKAAVFWMRYEGDDPATGTWTTHPIKWGSGTTAVITEFGEKWDQVRIADVDGDGDLDIVANNEEWWSDGGAPTPFWVTHPGAVHAVVWFENRLDEEPYRLEPDGDGGWRVEAEHHTDLADGTWVPRHAPTDDPAAAPSGTGYLQAGEMLVTEAAAWDDHGPARFAGTFPGGTYVLAVCCRAPAVWGAGLGGERSDEVWVGVDGAPAGGPLTCPAGDAWAWRTVTVTLDGGDHEVELRQREGGVMIDALALTPTAG
jgi:hypothetical protein